MPRTPPFRVLAAVLVGGGLLTSGCVVQVTGSARPAVPAPPDVTDAELPVVGSDDGEVDTVARNALADLETYWAEQLPAVFDVEFEPLEGGYFSVDPADADPTDYPDGIGCGSDPEEVAGNAFYCEAGGLPNSDSISYDRSYLAELADRSGRFLPALVMAHEFGHAVQARARFPRTSIATETQADCLAGAWTVWVADGQAPHTRIREPDLDDVLRAYLQLRDPVGTGADDRMAHGSYFDRVSAFQEGFAEGPEACRDNFGPGRVYTQDEFDPGENAATGGDAPYGELAEIISAALPEFWEEAFREDLGGDFDPPSLEGFTGTPPDCAPPGRDLVVCADGSLVGYDEQDLTRPLYEEVGDYAVVTAVALPYALAARDQLGLSTDGPDALRSAVCLTGWFTAEVFAGELRSASISPGDVDESVQFLLDSADDPAVLGPAEVTGFALVDLFRGGFLDGAAACDVAR
ncbi:neutral zinc metallopeptidase [Blastococcus sp. SYSU D00820]